MRQKALVILSGGQDSTTCLFWAQQQGYKEIHAITFDYGQRHIIELEAARKVAKMAGVTSHEFVEIPNCLKSVSPLTSANELDKYSDFNSMAAEVGDSREKTFVPMRNALFLTVAANRAEALGDCDLITGVCQMDNANYDDCRQVFIRATEMYINTALGHDHRDDNWINIVTPLMWLDKGETVKLAWNLHLESYKKHTKDNNLPFFLDSEHLEGFPDTCWDALAYSHTSYDGKYPPTDMNHANVLRAQGFLDAGRADPLVVRAWEEGLMDLPETSNYNEVG